MPELAEVEVVRDILDKDLSGLTIIDVKCFYKPIIENDLDVFLDNVINKKIENIARLAKYLIFNLDKGHLISHLRMEGKYFYLPKEEINNKHIHVVFYLSNGYMLCYQDVRKFGRILYLEDDIYNKEPLCNVGVEANNDVYDIDLIYKKLQNKKISIKTALLDQSIISGLGNIYVDEVLFASKINPNRSAFSITKEEICAIMSFSRVILNKAIECKGTTIRSYTSSLGVIGGYQEFLKVHTKEVCPDCRKALCKIKIGGRTSYYCDDCQK